MDFGLLIMLKTLSSIVESVYRQSLLRTASSTNFRNLQPNDMVTVYHGTDLGEVFRLINGFDATRERPRSYASHRHPGLFVSPSFKLAEQFAPHGVLVLEIVVRAKNLHGTDYGGNIGRYQDFSEQHKKYLQDKYPNSFRPYLTESMLAKGEPQALLLGLVSPDQITRVWYSPVDKSVEARWYTRKEFLNLGIVAKEYSSGREKELVDVGVDLSYPGYTLDEFFEVAKELRGYDKSKIIKAFTRELERNGLEGLENQIATIFGFDATAARSYAQKFEKAFG